MRTRKPKPLSETPEIARAQPLAQGIPQPMPAYLPGPRDLGYSQAVYDSWRDYFQRLPAGARLLDIATGIGPVALIAQEVSSGHHDRFEVHSLDQAATLNGEPLSLNGIHLHVRGYGNSTPFEGGYFDAISVQWAPPDESIAATGLAELRRILKAGGRARFMFHALGGATHEQCLGRMRAASILLDELHLLEHARHMFEVAFTLRTVLKRDVMRAVTLAMKSQQDYAQMARWAAYLMRDTPNPKGGEQILQVIAACWERRDVMTLAEIQAHLDRLEADLRAAQARMRAACSLAVDETRAHRIGKLFKAAGFGKVKIKPFKAPEGVLIGWDLQAV